MRGGSVGGEEWPTMWARVRLGTLERLDAPPNWKMDIQSSQQLISRSSSESKEYERRSWDDRQNNILLFEYQLVQHISYIFTTVTDCLPSLLFGGPGLEDQWKDNLPWICPDRFLPS